MFRSEIADKTIEMDPYEIVHEVEDSGQGEPVGKVEYPKYDVIREWNNDRQKLTNKYYEELRRRRSEGSQ